MKSLRLFAAALFIVMSALLTSCQTESASRQALPPPPEIIQTNYLHEIVRYLDRWQLDDAEINELYKNESLVFWVERLNPHLDEGDNSILAEIFLPQLDMSLKVKKPDYRVEELNTTVKGQSFKITEVSRGNAPTRRPRNAVEVKAPVKELRDYLFDTRNEHDYPDAALVERLRAAARAELAKDLNKTTNTPATDQTIFLSPLSPAANDLWVFWEDRSMLFHFASDIELSNPAVWEHESLWVHAFDIDQQVVVSHEEEPGSNRFLTRNEVGRVLYNCVVLGKKITLTP